MVKLSIKSKRLHLSRIVFPISRCIAHTLTVFSELDVTRSEDKTYENQSKSGKIENGCPTDLSPRALRFPFELDSNGLSRS
jgi:hypothetical protein